MKIKITDHAVVRYLERVDGPHPMMPGGRINIPKVREQILAEGRKEAIEMGAATITIGDTIFIIGLGRGKDAGTRTVITIVENTGRSPPKRPRASNR